MAALGPDEARDEHPIVGFRTVGEFRTGGGLGTAGLGRSWKRVSQIAEDPRWRSPSSSSPPAWSTPVRRRPDLLIAMEWNEAGPRGYRAYSGGAASC
jgi:hypothetical protein